MKRNQEPVYPNLAAEIGRKGLILKTVAENSQIEYQSFLNKYNGVTEYVRSEMLRVRDNNFPGLTLEYLFERSA
jgi:hypothetical protein